jgi:DNA (cytosine-5)-methyltransferase 1
MLRVLDLFSGIGGFSLGLERTGGFETVAFCEIARFQRAVLRKHWPRTACFRNVKFLTRNKLARFLPIDVICGGFPCQPTSLAGDRLGAEDDRWLWPEYRRLVEELRPAWVLGENPLGLVSMGLDQVLADLEALGYAWRPFDIPACAVGANHERERVWIIAHAGSFGLQGERAGRDAGAQEIDDAGCAFAGSLDAYGADAYGRQQSFRWPAGRVLGSEPLSRHGDWEITSEPFIRRGVDGLPKRMDRISALGNAVIPQIPEIIGRAILEAEQRL